jgi:hypothetical protein
MRRLARLLTHGPNSSKASRPAYTKKKLTVKEIMDTLTPPEGADSVAWDAFVVDSSSGTYKELTPDEYDVQEQIAVLAYEAQYSGDDSKLVSFLKEKGLYDKLQDIIKKYGIEQHSKNLSMSRKAVSQKWFSSPNFIAGDIFLKYDPSSSSEAAVLNVIIPGKWGHAAFLDTDKRDFGYENFLLSASNETDEPKGFLTLGRVGYDKTIGYWTGAKEVSVHRVKNASSAQRKAAIKYSAKFIDKPFGFVTTRKADDEFYCSKLVYRGWKSQGYELEPHKDSFTGLPWIIGPTDVRWDYKTVWGVRIYYPVIIMDYWPDIWVTPTDLCETDKTSVVKF